ncbi:hypothetical protein PIB30_083924 [Stylosanthes scabra]|uniref:J domain-containing protein n=1 Tax=Stylosanthes scabra TaxID=79078 RepID=A0ABU6QTM8_9FABA|nr:hypothetical protein [Stylosanthes scabra]
MMNSAIIKATIFNNSNTKCLPFTASSAFFFHSTPFLERKRHTSWNSRRKHFSRIFRRIQEKRTLLRNANAYAEYLFQRWKVDNDEEDPSSSQGPSWFREQYTTPKGSRRYRKGNQGSKHRFKRDTEFCEDDIDVDNFSSGGNRYFYWSFVHEENSQWERWEGFSNYGKSFNWRHGSEKAYEFSTESESSCSGSVPDRLALGLNSSGPLKLEDVKNAYRACALKWHPDRHQGSSKVLKS